jgi:hypothetical protein
VAAQPPFAGPIGTERTPGAGVEEGTIRPDVKEVQAVRKVGNKSRAIFDEIFMLEFSFAMLPYEKNIKNQQVLGLMLSFSVIGSQNIHLRAASH